MPSPRAGQDQQLFDGALLSLTRFGARPSKLVLEEPKKATLVFKARFIDRIRDDTGESREIATLKGEVVVEPGPVPRLRFTGDSGEGGEPQGIVPAEPIDPLAFFAEERAEGDVSELRILRFRFDSDQFRRVVAERQSEAELFLKLDPVKFRCFEVSASLEVGGVQESSELANDLLDVLITRQNPTPFEVVSVRLTDELGEAMPGANVKVLFGATGIDGASTELVANGDGEVDLRARAGATTCELSWGKSSPGEFKRTISLDVGDDPDTSAARRLENLGFSRSFDDAVSSFQTEFGREPTGNALDIEPELVAWHDGGTLPERVSPTEPDDEAVAIAVPRRPGEPPFETGWDEDAGQESSPTEVA